MSLSLILSREQNAINASHLLSRYRIWTKRYNDVVKSGHYVEIGLLKNIQTDSSNSYSISTMNPTA